MQAAVIQEDPEERALKRRKLTAEVARAELENRKTELVNQLDEVEYITVKAHALLKAKSALQELFTDED